MSYKIPRGPVILVRHPSPVIDRRRDAVRAQRTPYEAPRRSSNRALYPANPPSDSSWKKDPEVWVCYAAAYLAEALRGSPYGVQVQLADLADIARRAYGRTGDPAVAELADTVDRARAVLD